MTVSTTTKVFSEATLNPLLFSSKPFQTSKTNTLIYKQTKYRNETGSNLSLGTRLTVLSKRLGRKRCCDTTPDRFLEVCHLTISASHCKKGFVFEITEDLVGSHGLKRTK